MSDYDSIHASASLSLVKIAKTFCENTGMSAEVFRATVRGNIDQAWTEHVADMIAREVALGNEERAEGYRQLPSEHNLSPGLEAMVWEREAEKIADAWLAGGATS